VRTVPDKCPFCESPIMVHVGNLLRSEDGGFATYKCKTVQDVRWDEKYIRDGQSDVCRILEVQLLTKQRDEARERIKRLEEAWIPASTKPEGYERRVLLWVVWQGFGWRDQPEAKIGWWKHGPGCFAFNEFENADHLVTHWMEIADPTKAKEAKP
jgi:hypothetical protein